MTVRDLMELLEGLDEDAKILFKPDNSIYVEEFSDRVRTEDVRKFWGSDCEAYVIFSDGQVGAV